MFVGRGRELATLQRLYDTPGFQFPVIYGRRRVGKTYLMGQFVKSRPTIFFTAVENSADINLRNLSREIYLFDHPDADPTSAPIYRDLQTAIETIFSRASNERLVFVIDEYPYLAKADPSVSSVLQALIDRNKEASQLYLMLCGSSLSFMREQVLGDKSPLYGRRTSQLEIHPLDFFDARQFFPDASTEEAISYYGMAGGVPLYLEQFRSGATLEDNIEYAFLQPSSFLYEEPQNLLKQEVRKASVYNAIIGAIASGKTTGNEIATTVGMGTAEIAYYFKELQNIGLVEREEPVLASRRRPLYKLTDPMFRFWYRFVLPNKSAIERGMPQRALRSIENHLAEYLGPVFEQVCAEWLWRQSAQDNLPVSFDELGRWWGNDPSTKREEEIDIVGVDGKNPVLVAECKWKNEPLGEAVSKELLHRLSLLRRGVQAHRYLFSKRDFTAGCIEEAKRDPLLHLVSLDEMLA